jgi:single-strand DNA-binding protein
MINDLNRVVLMGHVGTDAAQQNSNAPVTFTLATSDRWTDDKQQRQSRTEWHRVVVFGNLGKYAAKLKKGDRVYVEGQLRTSSYEKPAGDGTVTVSSTEIVAGQIERVAASSSQSE